MYFIIFLYIILLYKLGLQRGAKSLKNKWEKLKKEVKQRLALEKKEIYKTGGGTVKKFKPIFHYEQIVELLGVSACGLDCDFDSDVIGRFKKPNLN